LPLYIRVSRTIVSPGKFERHDVFCALPLGLKQNHEGMTLFQVCELFGKLVGKLVEHQKGRFFFFAFFELLPDL